MANKFADVFLPKTHNKLNQNQKPCVPTACRFKACSTIFFHTHAKRARRIHQIYNKHVRAENQHIIDTEILKNPVEIGSS